MAKTSKYISTISYNSKKFLLDKLDSLIYQRIIVYYEFIEHLPDEDDLKKHIHLFIIPNQSLDLGFFKDMFCEYIFNFPKRIKKIIKYIYPILILYGRQSYKNKKKFKPLGCLPFRVTHKYGDWYWYILHNKDYLRSKEMTRNVYYSDNDVFTSDLDFHSQLVHENKLEDFCTMGDVQLFKFCFNGVQNNISLADLLSTGYVPLNKVNQFKTLYNSIYSNSNFILSNTDHERLKQNKIVDIFHVNIDNSVISPELRFNTIDGDLPFKDELYD